MGLFSLTVRGLQEAIVKFKGLNKKSVDATVPFTVAKPLMIASINKNFEEGGRPAKWKPLAKSTVKQKLKKGHTKTLIVTGKMKNSVVGEAFPRKLEIGTNDKKAPWHQFGTSRGIPAREFLLFQDEDLERIERIVMDHLESAFSG